MASGIEGNGSGQEALLHDMPVTYLQDVIDENFAGKGGLQGYVSSIGGVAANEVVTPLGTPGSADSQIKVDITVFDDKGTMKGHSKFFLPNTGGETKPFAVRVGVGDGPLSAYVDSLSGQNGSK
jgi:hypothetical protein